MLFALPLFLCGRELLKDNDWSKAKPDGSPAGFWRYDNKGTYKYTPQKGNIPGVVSLTPGGKKQDACLTCDNPVKFPAGTELTLTGEYRTIDFVPGKKGNVFANICINYNRPDRAWMGIFLKPTAGKWQKFSRVKKFADEAKGPFRLYLYIKGESGSVEWRNISLKAKSGNSEVKPGKLYVWREAEDVFKKFPAIPEKECSNGKAVYAENKPCVWKFRISPVTDSKTLFEKEFTYHLWIKTYGYLKNPVITAKLNDRYLADVKTVSNEKADAQGNYAGPGFYYWQYIGSFKSKGGSYSLSLQAPRLCMDSLLLTDDAAFTPKEFEARNNKKNRISDVFCANELYAEFSNFGVSADVTAPVSFRITKPARIIPKGGKPAKFHFSVPEYIEVAGATSHRATTKWGQSNTWLGRKLAWRKTGKSVYKGIRMNNYEMDIYYLCGNQYWWFLKVKKEAFKNNKRFPARYYLVNGSEKQEPETMYLTMTEIPEAKPFKKIYVCGGGAEFSGFWNGWDGIWQTGNFAGLNAMAVWGFERGLPAAQKEFLAKAKTHNVRIFGALSPFWPPMKLAPEERAIGLDGKYYKRGSMFVPALYQNENSKALRYMRDYLYKSAKAGTQGMLMDDEWSNQIFDKVDYHPETKKLFKKYLEDKGEKYVDPLVIVKNKKKYGKLHQLWIDFRCERMAEFYRILRKAYLSGLADQSDPMFCTGIQGRNSTPERIKASNFLDYRLLAKHCDMILIMCYTYTYIRQSAEIGDTVRLYNKHLGKKICTPALLSEYEGLEIPEDQKVMHKYQLWEALMAQSRLIEYWMSYGMYNPRNLRHIAEGIRQLSPYENILLDGKEVNSVKSSAKFLRIKALKLDKKLLIYVSNYQHPANLKAPVDIGVPVKKLTALVNGKAVKINGNKFIFDSSVERGQLFLAEL